MTVQENRSFQSVKECKTNYNLSDVISSPATKHLSERNLRIRNALNLNNGAEVDKVFLVDKGHPNGAELHIVTDKGIIFILNNRTGKLITLLIARPNQVRRLYNACGQEPKKSILSRCRYHAENGFNF